MFRDLKDLYSLTDKAVEEIQDRYRKEVLCKKGCTHCCYAVFDVSLIEALYLRSHFDSLDRRQRRAVLVRARKAIKAWDQLIATGTDISIARIRCPLLTDKGECACYAARPINCRTYGIPTVIGGKGHVCGFSGFEKGKEYITLNLEPLEKRLYELSVRLKGEDLGSKRWPIAAVLLWDDSLHPTLRR
jgi:Fe-S-cluster containining protein